MRKLHIKHDQGNISKVMCSRSHRCYVEIGSSPILFPKVIPSSHHPKFIVELLRIPRKLHLLKISAMNTFC